MTDNAYYLEALLKGSSKDIRNIYKKNFPRVRGFVLQNKGRQEDAEDVFQKALLQLAIRYKKEKFEIRQSFEAYLFTVCKNLWRRELNKSKNKVTNGIVIEPKNEERDMALSILEQKRWELFTESLELISENCKKILKMFFDKVSYAQIVINMQYNSETVARQRVFKCKNQLRKLIEKDHRMNALREL